MMNNNPFVWSVEEVKNMPDWVRAEKYYNCAEFFEAFRPKKAKKVKKNHK